MIRKVFKKNKLHDLYNINSLKKNGIIIFGVGIGGQILSELFIKINVPIICFLDNYNYNCNYLGINVYHSSVKPAHINVSSNILIIISITNFKDNNINNYKIIKDELKKNNWTNIISRPEFLSVLFYENKSKISFINNIWEDKKSSEVYIQSLNYLSTRSKKFEPIKDNNQYFIEDIPNFISKINKLRWVQGGAYIGDSILLAINLNILIDEVALFEPDLNNYTLLVKNINKQNILASCWPCALWDKYESLQYNSGYGAANFINENGNILVQGIDLDSALPFFNPNFITLDIEGSEIRALNGMKETIIRYRPNLCISIYHKPDDWWEIPLFIYNLNKLNNLNYVFYLRVHDINATDVIMYCIYNVKKL
jgi:FkbM family methyltransferase